MNLEKILSISGKPGLYALKVQTRTGFLAESLVDGKKISVGLKVNVSLLSEISIYTFNAEKPLTEVMRNIAIKENEGPAISHKEDNATLVAYFTEILPEYDSERVYPSDIKKVLSWYNLLQSKGLVSKEEPNPEISGANAAEIKEKVVEEVVAEKAPAKKSKAKKA
ncbi:DUF5606 domain-containing protein [Flavobacterium sp.]|uniref:DUF5606 family protein n=1 Tax=Flavobacterium sp. TaxID=239 RepID=UPI00286E962F|nr:DUF5606 domain-containing protein [Flavobacterium sp.]